jgi:hypothetical protein
VLLLFNYLCCLYSRIKILHCAQNVQQDGRRNGKRIENISYIDSDSTVHSAALYGKLTIRYFLSFLLSVSCFMKIDPAFSVPLYFHNKLKSLIFITSANSLFLFCLSITLASSKQFPVRTAVKAESVVRKMELPTEGII